MADPFRFTPRPASASASPAAAAIAAAIAASAAAAAADDIDDLTPDELDRLPYGMIQLDRTGRILSYNAVESRLAALPKDEAIGKQFFTEIAPCTRVQEFHGRFQEGVIHESLDTSFRFHFAFKQAPRDVTVRLLYSRRSRTVWVLIADHEGKPLDAPG